MKLAANMLALVLLVVCVASPVSAKKEKMVVQLYALAVGFEQEIEIVNAYLILPDGSHAFGHCWTTPHEQRPCYVESFIPVKKRRHECKGTCCAYRENFKAEREGNDITLFAANGKVTFHISSSWSKDPLAD